MDGVVEDIAACGIDRADDDLPAAVADLETLGAGPEDLGVAHPQMIAVAADGIGTLCAVLSGGDLEFDLVPVQRPELRRETGHELRRTLLRRQGSGPCEHQNA